MSMSHTIPIVYDSRPQYNDEKNTTYAKSIIDCDRSTSQQCSMLVCYVSEYHCRQ